MSPTNESSSKFSNFLIEQKNAATATDSFPFARENSDPVCNVLSYLFVVFGSWRKNIGILSLPHTKFAILASVL